MVVVVLGSPFSFCFGFFLCLCEGGNDNSESLMVDDWRWRKLCIEAKVNDEGVLMMEEGCW